MNTKRLLLGLYEDKGDWDKAYFLRQSLNRWLKRKDHYILALYRVQSGIELVQRGAEREARIRFREAIKLDKSCAPAYLYWGDSYRRENRNADAVQVWLDFTETNPESAYLAFERLNGVLYDLGRYNEMEAIYKNVISRKPKNPTAYLNLIDIYKKQGKLDEALDLCESIFENHPDSPQCRLMRVQLLQMKGLGHKALEEVTDHLGRETEKSSVFRCKTCGNESQTPLWHCPQCKQWNTYIH
jgi:lipopolysaccharide biosynthesis regulator YciM